MSTRSFVLVALAAAFVSVAACSSSATPGEGDAGEKDAGAATPVADATAPVGDTSVPTDASTADTSAPDSGVCHALTQLGDPIVWTSTTATAPTAAGGTFTDGTYALTSFKIYSNAFADGTVVSQIGRATLEVRGTNASLLLTTPDGSIARSNETWTVNGMDLASAQTCVNALDGGGQSLTTGGSKFTATPTSIVLLYNNPNGIIENVYTKK